MYCFRISDFRHTTRPFLSKLMGSIRSDGCQNTEFELFQQQSEALNGTRVLYERFMRESIELASIKVFSLEFLLIPTFLHHTITSQRHEKLTKDKKCFDSCGNSLQSHTKDNTVIQETFSKSNKMKNNEKCSQMKTNVPTHLCTRWDCPGISY